MTKTTKKMELGEVLGQISRLRQIMAVYDLGIAYLNRFLPSDTAEKPMPVNVEGCEVAVVSYDVIEEAIDQLVSQRGIAENKLNKLRKLEVFGD